MAKEFKLPKYFGEKWVTALRSGKYGQTIQKLTDFNNNYCCIGIACKTVGLSAKRFHDLNFASIASGIDEDSEMISMVSGIPYSLGTKLHKRLTDMNDLENKSFHEIADWIEQNVEFI